MSKLNKIQIREDIKLSLDNLSDDEINLKSKKIENKLLLNEIFSESDIFFIYLSNRKEVQTLEIIEKLLKN
jgi:5-formyltetrahydrofolate cyclo-ligase